MSTRRKTPKQQEAGRCVFCGGGNLTKEHIWSDWLSKSGLFPTVESHSWAGLHQRTIVDNQAGSSASHTRPHFQMRQGSALQRKIRNVCKACNGGWMSVLVSSAKPFAEKMVRDEATVMSPDDRRNVAGWIALAVIMAEFTDIQSAGIPAADRERVWENKVPPDSWSIFLGRYVGTDWGTGAYRHTGGKVSLLPIEAASAVQGQAPVPVGTWQATTYTLGALVVHAISSTAPAHVQALRGNWSHPPMVRLWPPPEVPESIEDLTWPASPVLGDDDLNKMVSEFRQSIVPPDRQLPDDTEELISALTINGIAVIPGDRIIKSGTLSGKGLVGQFTVFNRTGRLIYNVQFNTYALNHSGERVDDVVEHQNLVHLPPKTAWFLTTGFGVFRPLDPVKMPSLHIEVTFSRRIMGLREKASFTYLPGLSPRGYWHWVPQQ